MARVRRKMFDSETVRAAWLALILGVMITTAGECAEHGVFRTGTWYLQILRGQGADFSYVPMLTGAVMLIMQLRVRNRVDQRHYAKWGPLEVSLFFMLDGFLIELFQTMHGHGDWRDVTAETIGWICTIVPITLVQRRSRAAVRPPSYKAPASAHL